MSNGHFVGISESEARILGMSNARLDLGTKSLDIDETEFPRNLGINEFIKKYHAEFPKIIERYHPDRWELTQELEQLGSTVPWMGRVPHT